MKEVSMDNLILFIKGYKRKLTEHYTGDHITYNDCSYGLEYPESVVAKLMPQFDGPHYILGKTITKSMAKKLKAERFNREQEELKINYKDGE